MHITTDLDALLRDMRADTPPCEPLLFDTGALVGACPAGSQPDMELSQAFVARHNAIELQREMLDSEMRFSRLLATSVVDSRAMHTSRLEELESFHRRGVYRTFGAVVDTLVALQRALAATRLEESCDHLSSRLLKCSSAVAPYEDHHFSLQRFLRGVEQLVEMHARAQAYEADHSLLLRELGEYDANATLDQIDAVRIRPFSADVVLSPSYKDTRPTSHGGDWSGLHLKGRAINLYRVADAYLLDHEECHTLCEPLDLQCGYIDKFLRQELLAEKQDVFGKGTCSRDMVEAALWNQYKVNLDPGALVNLLHGEFVADTLLAAGAIKARYWYGNNSPIHSTITGSEIHAGHPFSCLAVAAVYLQRAKKVLLELAERCEPHDRSWLTAFASRYERSAAAAAKGLSEGLFIGYILGREILEEVRAAAAVLRPTQYGGITRYLKARYGAPLIEPLQESFKLLVTPHLSTDWMGDTLRHLASLPSEYQTIVRGEFAKAFTHACKVGDIFRKDEILAADGKELTGKFRQYLELLVKLELIGPEFEKRIDASRTQRQNGSKASPRQRASTGS